VPGGAGETAHQVGISSATRLRNSGAGDPGYPRYVPSPLGTALSLGRHIVRYYPGDVHQPVLGLQKSRLAGTGRVADD